MAALWLEWAQDPKHLAVAFSSLGALLHISLIPFEIDEFSAHLASAFALFWLGLATAFVRILEMDVISAILRTFLAGFSFVGALATSMTIYRLFFHRLRRFPGPLGAKISRFSVMSDISNSGLKYHVELENLHQKYGDFVRVGPREISINRASAVNLVLGPQSKCRKSAWYSIMTRDPHKNGIVGIRDHEVHRQRRKVWDKGCGNKAIADYIPRIEGKADLLIEKLKEQTGNIIDMTKWSLFFSFDVMGLLAFSKDYEQLKDGKEHFAIAAMHEQMELVGLFSAVPWLMLLLQSIPGIAGSFKIFMNYCNKQMDERRAEWKQDTKGKPNDIVSWLIKAMEDGDPAAPSCDMAFYEDGRVTIVAGSDTTGASLANAFYFLAAHPEKFQRLQKEVDQAKARGEDASHLPYLDAIITETLRLKPVVPSGLKRETPPEGMMVDDVWIPGKTIVITPQYVLQRDERNFERALEFLPERWLEEGKHLHKDDHAWFPFSLGHYSCVGKQIAMMKLRFALSKVANEFDISFAPQEDGKKFHEEAKDTFTMTCPSLPMVFNERAT